MSLSPPSPSPNLARGELLPAWDVRTSESARGLCLAREKGWLLNWNDKNWLQLLGRSGQPQGQAHLPDEVTAAGCADDGSAIVAGGGRGQVWWFAPDLTLRWERTVSGKVLAVAVDLFGQCVAVADSQGRLYILDRLGRAVSTTQSQRPLHHLAFVPTAPLLVGAADYGLVAVLDFSGQVKWREGVVADIGSVAVNEDGSRIALACFSEGVQQYSATGQNLGRVTLPEPCRLAALSFDGGLILCAGMSPKLFLLDQAGQLLYSHSLDRPAAGIALAPLGDAAAVALPHGRVLGLDLRSLPSR